MRARRSHTECLKKISKDETTERSGCTHAHSVGCDFSINLSSLKKKKSTFSIFYRSQGLYYVPRIDILHATRCRGPAVRIPMSLYKFLLYLARIGIEMGTGYQSINVDKGEKIFNRAAVSHITFNKKYDRAEYSDIIINRQYFTARCSSIAAY